MSEKLSHDPDALQAALLDAADSEDEALNALLISAASFIRRTEMVPDEKEDAARGG